MFDEYDEETREAMKAIESYDAEALDRFAWEKSVDKLLQQIRLWRLSSHLGWGAAVFLTLLWVLREVCA